MSDVLLAVVLAAVFALAFAVLFAVLKARAERPYIEAGNKALDAVDALIGRSSRVNDEL